MAMGTLDSLPGDERAVLQLVLQRGRSYEQIADVLDIEPAAVRRRALSALEALAPQPELQEDRRRAVGDYLLSQLPEAERPDVQAALARSAAERAWARRVAMELAPLAGNALPPIPAEDEATGSIGSGPELVPAAPEGEAAAERPHRASGPPAPEGEAAAERPHRASGSPAPEGEAATELPHRASEPPAPRRRGSRRSAAVTALTAIVVAILIVVLVTRGSSSSRGTASHPGAAAASTSSGSSQTSSTAATVLGQINLTPSSPSSKAVGVADVIRQGSGDAVAIVAQNVPPNRTDPPNAYAVWLYNSPRDAAFLGFVNPAVGTNGRLSTAGPLPTDHARYRELIITLETSSKPTRPGPMILEGPLNGL